MHHA